MVTLDRWSLNTGLFDMKCTAGNSIAGRLIAFYPRLHCFQK